MKNVLYFLSYLLLLQALFATAYGRQRHLTAPVPQIEQSNVAEPALEPAMELPAVELAPGQTAGQRVDNALGTASQTVSNVGGSVVNGTANVANAVVGTVAGVGRTVQDLAAVIGAVVGRKLQAVDQN